MNNLTYYLDFIYWQIAKGFYLKFFFSNVFHNIYRVLYTIEDNYKKYIIYCNQNNFNIMILIN